jgi:hypothetical protein
LPTANPLVATLMGPPPEGAAIPVGLVLDTMLEVPGAPPEPESRVAQTRLGHRLGALVDTVINGADLSLADASPVPVCHLPAKGYSATEFSMTQRRAQALVDAATNVARRYFDALEATHQSR